MMTPGNAARVGVVLAACVAAVGSSTATTGDMGMVEFKPDNCGWGLAACTFFDGAGIAAGTSLDLQIADASSNAPLTNLTLTPSNAILAVTGPTSSGIYTLTAVSDKTQYAQYGDGEEVDVMLSVSGLKSDTTFVPVAVAEKLGFKQVSMNDRVSVSMSDPVFNGVWTVPVNESVIFQLVPKSRARTPLMGRFSSATPYMVMRSTLDGVGTGSSDGRLVVQLPMGAPPATITYQLMQPSPLPTLTFTVQFQVARSLRAM